MGHRLSTILIVWRNVSISNSLCLLCYRLITKVRHIGVHKNITLHNITYIYVIKKYSTVISNKHMLQRNVI